MSYPSPPPTDAIQAGLEVFDPVELEAGRRLFAQDCTFYFGVQSLKQLPPEHLPEIAFAGRSNVGKSSLVNALTGRKTLARTSNTPGRTQQLNFFDLGGRLALVDLPGYGYARVSKSLSASWQSVLKGYLAGRVPLKRALVLIDGRHGIKDADRPILTLLDKSAVETRVILTKSDKVKPPERARLETQLLKDLKKHPSAFPVPLWTSSETGEGIADLRAGLTRLAAEDPIR